MAEIDKVVVTFRLVHNRIIEVVFEKNLTIKGYRACVVEDGMIFETVHDRLWKWNVGITYAIRVLKEYLDSD